MINIGSDHILKKKNVLVVPNVDALAGPLQILDLGLTGWLSKPKEHGVVVVVFVVGVGFGCGLNLRGIMCMRR